MKKFVLDTDTISNLLRNVDESLTKKISSIDPNHICTTIINYCELYEWLNRFDNILKRKLIEDFINKIEILQLDTLAAQVLANERKRLRKQGNLIKDMDILIAAISIANNATLITCNLRHFDRIKSLKVENWLS